MGESMLKQARQVQQPNHSGGSCAEIKWGVSKPKNKENAMTQ